MNDHYDFTSAMIKIMRSYDSEEVICWFGRLLKDGEDPRFI